jgi:hypothetical protein
MTGLAVLRAARTASCCCRHVTSNGVPARTLKRTNDVKLVRNMLQQHPVTDSQGLELSLLLVT